MAATRLRPCGKISYSSCSRKLRSNRRSSGGCTRVPVDGSYAECEIVTDTEVSSDTAFTSDSTTTKLAPNAVMRLTCAWQNGHFVKYSKERRILISLGSQQLADISISSS